MICSISPVGSRGSSDFSSIPAGDASRSSVSWIASRSPRGVKRAGVTVSLNR